jgi:hypothetical protein
VLRLHTLVAVAVVPITSELQTPTALAVQVAVGQAEITD